MTTKEIRIRCWVEIDGIKFFGPGPAELLEGIQREGSIAQAAKHMGMSYKKAWDIVEDLNTRSSIVFVRSQKGGRAGGSAVVTEEGARFLARYRQLTDNLNAVIEKETDLLKLI